MSASGLIIIGSMMLAAEFIFGMAMVSKANRLEKANNAEKENDTGKKVIAATSAVMLTTLLGFGIAVACVSGKSDKTEDSAPGTVTETSTETITTTAEEATEASATTTTRTTTATETTTTTQTTTTTETTTTMTTTTTVPLSELDVVGKGNEGGFICDYYSDGSIWIGGVIDESYKGSIPTYKEVYGTDVTNVIIPREVNGYLVRNISFPTVASMMDLDWKGVKSISVPKGVALSGVDVEIAFDEKAAYLSQYGITLSVY